MSSRQMTGAGGHSSIKRAYVLSRKSLRKKVKMEEVYKIIIQTWKWTLGSWWRERGGETPPQSTWPAARRCTSLAFNKIRRRIKRTNFFTEKDKKKDKKKGRSKRNEPHKLKGLASCFNLLHSVDQSLSNISHLSESNSQRISPQMAFENQNQNQIRSRQHSQKLAG